MSEELFLQAVRLQERGEDEQALALYKQVLAQKIREFECYANMGLLFRKHNATEEAIGCYEQVVRLRPFMAEYQYILGILYSSVDRLLEAKPCFEQAVALDAANWQAGLNLAKIYFNQGKNEEAEKYFLIALAIEPEIVDAFVCLCQIYRARNDLEKALFYGRKALEVDKDSPAVHGFVADLELRTGQWYEGFQEYEWRKKLISMKKFFAPLERLPQWQGELFSGKKLVVLYEQGLGDTLQFVRYLPQVKARGGFVAFYCQASVKRLLQGISGADLVTDQVNLDEYDLIVPLLSLPRIFATTLNTTPANIPYIAVKEEWVLPWNERIKAKRNLKVGLVWSGNTYNNAIPGRSCKLKDMLPLAAVPNVQFYSLQLGDAKQELAELADQWPILDYTEHIQDFADTAAFVSQLDLVISIDTSVPHLVGAIGQPVWIALPFINEWRWLLHRMDTPWYPTAILFRQETEGDWHSVFTNMATHLSCASQKW